MTTRVLPPSEWARLAQTEMGPALAAINPDAITVIVAEDDNGEAIGCWGLVSFAHLEGMWIRPDHRRKGAVLKRMWNDICGLAAARGIAAVFTGAADPAVERWILKRGGLPVPFESFVLPLKPVGRVV